MTADKPGRVDPDDVLDARNVLNQPLSDFHSSIRRITADFDSERSGKLDRAIIGYEAETTKRHAAFIDELDCIARGDDVK